MKNRVCGKTNCCQDHTEYDLDPNPNPEPDPSLTCQTIKHNFFNPSYFLTQAILQPHLLNLRNVFVVICGNWLDD
jgi:hypothetical protein